MSKRIIGSPFAILVCRWSYNLLGHVISYTFSSNNLLLSEDVKAQECSNYRKLNLAISTNTKS
jgi:hypothetical protein